MTPPLLSRPSLLMPPMMMPWMTAVLPLLHMKCGGTVSSAIRSWD